MSLINNYRVTEYILHADGRNSIFLRYSDLENIWYIYRVGKNKIEYLNFRLEWITDMIGDMIKEAFKDAEQAIKFWENNENKILRV